MTQMGEVREFIISNFLFGDPTRLSDQCSFIRQNIIDSTGVLELVTFLEDHFGISIEDEELIPENLDSLQGISRLLESKIKAA